MGVTARSAARLALGLAILLGPGCSSGRRVVDDGGPPLPDGSAEETGPDADSGDGGGDALPEADLDEPVGPDSDIDGPAEVPMCGNAVLDEGEECDDGNRLNGDGCDWLCRIGDGEEPPSEPDPDAVEYVLDGEPTPVAGAPSPETDHVVRLPLEWTGTALATAFQEELPSGSPTHIQVRFRRFAPDGRTLYPEWTHPLDVGGFSIGIDLVWTGEGFGFFFSDTGVGIYFLWLDEEMKPTGAPLLVVDAPRVGGLAADRAGEGFVLAWIVLTDREGPSCDGGRGMTSIAETWARVLGPRGETDARPGPVLVHDRVDWHPSPDVASSEGGYAVLVFPSATVGYPYCSSAVHTVAPDLDGSVTTGALSPSSGGEVLLDGDRFVVSWARDDARRETDDGALCQADVSLEGMLAGPPSCSPPGHADAILWMGPTHFASDGAGFLHLFQGAVGSSYPRDARLWAQRTDRRGIHVGEPLSLLPEVLGYAVERTDHGFGALLLVPGDGRIGELRYQRFVPAD